MPYVFQILAQMLTLHQGMPVDYRTLLLHLLTLAIWAQKGSILGLVALLRAFLARDAAAMVEANQHTSVLGVMQQRLVPSKANDGWGFELLQSVVLHVLLCVPASFEVVCPTGGVELNVFVLWASTAAIFPSDHHDAAHADAAEQDEQLRLQFCLLRAHDQRRRHHTRLYHPNRRRDPIRVLFRSLFLHF